MLEILEQLQLQINLLAKLRTDIQKAKIDLIEAKTAFENENKVIIDNVNSLIKSENEAEENLRKLTLKVYAETNNQHPLPGIDIVRRIELKYEPSEALNWAIDHRIAIMLDTKTFEKIAKTSPINFVKMIIQPTVFISSTLKNRRLK